MPVHGVWMGGVPLVGLGLAYVVGWLIALLIVAWFMEMGAKLAGIEDVSLGKSLIAIFGGGILAGIAGAVLFFLPVINVIVAFVVYIWVIKTVFNISWGKAFVAWLLAIILEIVTVVIIAFIIGAIL